MTTNWKDYILSPEEEQAIDAFINRELGPKPVQAEPVAPEPVAVRLPLLAQASAQTGQKATKPNNQAHWEVQERFLYWLGLREQKLHAKGAKCQGRMAVVKARHTQ
jgi:hypothetical protein